MKVYTGHKTRTVPAYVTLQVCDRVIELPKHNPQNHSPDGFEWGYSSSGSACLASSIVKDATGCNCMYQIYKAEVVALLPDTWRITDTEVIQKMIEIRRRLGHQDNCIHHPLYKEEPKGGDNAASS